MSVGQADGGGMADCAAPGCSYARNPWHIKESYSYHLHRYRQLQNKASQVISLHQRSSAPAAARERRLRVLHCGLHAHCSPQNSSKPSIHLTAMNWRVCMCVWALFLSVEASSRPRERPSGYPPPARRLKEASNASSPKLQTPPQVGMASSSPPPAPRSALARSAQRRLCRRRPAASRTVLSPSHTPTCTIQQHNQVTLADINVVISGGAPALPAPRLTPGSPQPRPQPPPPQPAAASLYISVLQREAARVRRLGVWMGRGWLQ
jgi:hypothetical protein